MHQVVTNTSRAACACGRACSPVGTQNVVGLGDTTDVKLETRVDRRSDAIIRSSAKARLGRDPSHAARARPSPPRRTAVTEYVNPSAASCRVYRSYLRSCRALSTRCRRGGSDEGRQSTHATVRSCAGLARLASVTRCPQYIMRAPKLGLLGRIGRGGAAGQRAGDERPDALHLLQHAAVHHARLLLNALQLNVALAL